MYSDFSDRLDQQEAYIRHYHNQQRQLRTHAELLQQELDLEDQILAENPEMADSIHQLNTAEISAQQQGMQQSFKFTGNTGRGLIGRIFPGI